MTQRNAKPIITLVFSPPGKRRQISDLLKTRYGKQRVFNVEQELADKLKKLDDKVSNIFDAINSFSRSILQEYWRETIKDIIGRIEAYEHEEEANNHYFILTNALYYKSTTTEFFSVVDAKFVNNSLSDKLTPIAQTVLFIDDIYDTFLELEGPKDLFGYTAFRQYKQNYKKFVELSDDKKDIAKLYISWAQYCLNLILSWRASEIILSQKISDELGSRFVLWSLKQDLDTLLEWLEKPNDKIFYISHAISEPRKELEEDKPPPSVITVINKVQIELRKLHIYSIMPTGIDELRLERTGNGYTGKLSMRWPVPEAVHETLSKNDLIRNLSSDILLPNTMDLKLDKKGLDSNSIAEIQDYVNGSFRVLESSILEQVGNRDHWLVWLTDAILVIGPYSAKKGKVHSGMEREIQYIKEVNRTTSPKRKISVILSKEDVQSILNRPDFTENYRFKLVQIVQREFPKLRENEGLVNELIDGEGNLVEEENQASIGRFLDANSLQSLRNNFSKYQEESKLYTVLNFASWLGQSDMEYTQPIIVQDFEQTLSSLVLEKIKQFLLHDKKDEEWKEIILQLASKRTEHP
ncbi:MAG: hypothetical protein HRF40_05400 [Nitrososphaera sp.]|jgi:hypothetical protein